MKRQLKPEIKKKLIKRNGMKTSLLFTIFGVFIVWVLDFYFIFFIFPVIGMWLLYSSFKTYRKTAFIIENGSKMKALAKNKYKTGLEINNYAEYAVEFELDLDSTIKTVTDKTFDRKKILLDQEYTIFYHEKFPESCISLELKNLNIDEIFIADYKEGASLRSKLGNEKDGKDSDSFFRE